MLIHLGIFSVMLECMVYIQQSQMVSVKVAEPEFLMQGGQQIYRLSPFSCFVGQILELAHQLHETRLVSSKHCYNGNNFFCAVKLRRCKNHL